MNTIEVILHERTIITEIGPSGVRCDDEFISVPIEGMRALSELMFTPVRIRLVVEPIEEVSA